MSFINGYREKLIFLGKKVLIELFKLPAELSIFAVSDEMRTVVGDN